MSTHAIGSGRPLFTLPAGGFAALLTVRLVSYRFVWTRRDEYVYDLTWSDGSITAAPTLPWDRLDGATETP